MTDFRAAFEAGQKAAEQADLARKEIWSVFSDVSKQVAEATDGKLEISLQKYEKQRLGQSFFIKPEEFFSPPKTFWGIAACNPKATEHKPVRIALWQQEPSGYPCKISWGNIDRLCHDRESLEQCLASLLGDAVVGKELGGLLMLPSREETGGGAAVDPPVNDDGP